MPSRPFLLFALLLAGLSAVGCTSRHGHGKTGQRCSADTDCMHGLCVAGVNGKGPACTVSCAKSEQCPHGWSCSALTKNNVLVCRKGAATPFGQ